MVLYNADYLEIREGTKHLHTAISVVVEVEREQETKQTRQDRF
jgi:hypothetical protein